MRSIRLLKTSLVITFMSLLFFTATLYAELPQPLFKVDKKLCALMLRYGKDAFERSRYEDAKYYFQKAVQADPGSSNAWNYYDLASFFVVGEQMKTQGKYVFRPEKPAETPKTMSPTSAAPSRETPASPPAQAPPPKPKAKSGGFKIVDDEGC